MPEEPINPLNTWRHEQPGVLRSKWDTYITKEPERAQQFINDPSLQFPAIFLLREALDTRDLNLAPRVSIALAQTRNILHGADQGLEANLSFPNQHDKVVDALSWMLKTGWDSILSTDYTQVIDQTAIQLLLTYRNDVLKELTDLIVYRYKNKSQRHYLISALFDSAEPRLLVYLANYLLSEQSAESEFAHRMLGFIPQVRHAPDYQTAFFAFESWYELNEHYLVYTGETNDAVPGGRPFRIHYSAKYLGKPVHAANGQPLQAMLTTEKINYDHFIRLSNRKQLSLSDYSAQLRQLQPATWRRWINQPIAEQLRSCPIPSGGASA
ncbi:MAG: hypothetical protein ABF586_01360 [Sporolactobacillus sp.]